MDLSIDTIDSLVQNARTDPPYILIFRDYELKDSIFPVSSRNTG